MASQLNPYLNFRDNARQAMEFYQSVFGGQLDVMTFGQMGGEPAEGVMHSYLGTPQGFALMGSDMPPEMGDPTPNGAISLSGDDGDELRGWFARLAQDGSVITALEKQVWGDEFGMCTDRFGVTWLVNISGPSDG